MAGKLFPFHALSLFFVLFRRPGNPLSFQGKLISNPRANTQLKFQKYSSLVHRLPRFSDYALIFHMEGALLRSSSLFPWFMLVAFEAGGILRALVLFLLYPLICLLGEKPQLEAMVFICFFGIRKEEFRIGRTVLPKFFLEDVGCEGLEVVLRCGKKVGVSDLPRVMVEGFLRDYLGVDFVVGRELKVVCGYFVGLMEEKRSAIALNDIFGDKKTDSSTIGIGSLKTSLDEQLFLRCEEVYMVTEAEKSIWKILPKDKYPKPLIFHDGRLAFRPTPLSTLVMFLWLPLGFFLFITRVFFGLLLPYNLSSPILAFTGTRNTISSSAPHTATMNSEENKARGILYVCNHRTLLDPIYVAATLMKNITAVTYSLSKLNEVISPVRTVRLTRERERDAGTIGRVLQQGRDLVVCPEGTTCREPFLLRFSPLFAEMSTEIVLVAIDVKVSMFYGTTASGLKCLDPFFHFLNPYPVYTLKILGKLPASMTCGIGGKSRFDVANHVQAEIANALGFECTGLTRRDKYMSLAGNEGFI
ncbi:probable glycerol-3-phosphate acyltransferase 3 [Malania oleifera]|uniref:probable glycerol-3-phosphate acyltransferase 3 n=1 Tax=Malania oleifera TaxID=397392 RepID=UPI0025ADA338|nr:probable glycerol-3-phosphate acyltransferase 3 [Malania oleifera]